MTHTPEQVELVARALHVASGSWFTFGEEAPGARDAFRVDATALLDVLRPLIEAQVREDCAKVADRYHAAAMEWAAEQSWLSLFDKETDSSRIAAEIRKGRG